MELTWETAPGVADGETAFLSSCLPVCMSVCKHFIFLPFPSLPLPSLPFPSLPSFYSTIGNPHPWCYLAFSSSAVLGNGDDKTTLWVGERFPHGPELERPNFLAFKKSIFPTDRIFQAALHKPGACKLDAKWTSCRVDQETRHYKRQDMCFGDYQVTYRWRLNDALSNATTKRRLVLHTYSHTHIHTYIES